MTTPPADLTDRRDPECRCWRNEVCGYLCPRCAGNQQREQLQAWAENWGNREVKAERKKPVLRLVRARELVR